MLLLWAFAEDGLGLAVRSAASLSSTAPFTRLADYYILRFSRSFTQITLQVQLEVTVKLTPA
jgi:hypothetical protein